MKMVSNNSIALLMIVLMLISLIGTTLISYLADKRASISGEVPIQQTGTVGVTVTAGATPEGGTSTGGGGGGGGGGGAPKTHIVDFRIKEIYSYFVDKGDTVIVIFSDDDKYILKVDAHRLKQTVSFDIDGTKFEVKSDEITSIDFDRDNLVDMTIKFADDGKIVFSLFHKPKTPEVVNPIISSQKISKDEAAEKPLIPEDKFNYIYILIFIIVLIIAILVYQHYRIRKVEKTQKKISLFNNTQDFYNLKDYINQSLARGIKKDKVIIELSNQGWTRKQLDYAFKNKKH